MKPLERAAKAAYESMNRNPWDRVSPEGQRRMCDLIRAGLETLMDPTREMSGAAGDGAVAEFAEDAWRAMLGKVLEG